MILEDNLVRVLILDDQLVQREGIAQVVGGSSYMKLVASTSNPDEALGILRQERIDLALVDLLLKKQRGTLVGRAMIQISPDLKVIIYTHENSMVLAADIFWSNKSTGVPGLHGYILTGNIIGAGYLQQVFEQILKIGHYIDPEVLEDNLRLAEFDPLTPREEECALLLAFGLSNDDISLKLGVSRHRIENMITDLYLKFRILGEPGNPGRRVCLAEAIHLLYGQDWTNIQRATVLVIDDQKPQREWIIQKLSREPRLRIIGEAANAQNGLDLVHQNKPAIVLVDLHLPDYDGFWLTRKILTEYPGTRVIIHSAAVSPVYEEEARAQGATAMIQKKQISGKLIYQMCVPAFVSSKPNFPLLPTEL